MSEYEILDLLSSYHQTVVTVSMAFLAICSGFAVMIHFIGRKLNPIQLVLVAVAYSAYLALPVIGIFGAVNRRTYLLNELKRLSGTEVGETATIFYHPLVFIVIWLLTIYYVWYVRRDVEQST